MFLSSLQLARLVPLRVMLPALPPVYRELEGGGKVGGVGWDELGGTTAALWLWEWFCCWLPDAGWCAVLV